MHSIPRCLALAASGFAIAILVACGGDSSTGPGNTNLSGNWLFGANISNGQLSISCTASGNLAITQSGSNFSGTVSGSTETCASPAGSTSGNLDGAIAGGQINGTSISFNDNGGCIYTGTMSGNPVNRVGGNVTCSIPLQGTNYPFTGSWSVTR